MKKKPILSYIFETHLDYMNTEETWISMGADPSKKWTEKYLTSVMSKAISGASFPSDVPESVLEKDGDFQTWYFNASGEINIFEHKAKSISQAKENFYKMNLGKHCTTQMVVDPSEEKNILSRYTTAMIDEQMIYQYPPHLQQTLRIFSKMFDVDIPEPSNDKLFIKELEDLKMAGGENQNAMVRAKSDYIRRKYDFETTRPRQVIKILKTAKKNMEEEWDSVHIPTEETEKIDKMKKGSLIEL